MQLERKSNVLLVVDTMWPQRYRPVFHVLILDVVVVSLQYQMSTSKSVD